MFKSLKEEFLEEFWHKHGLEKHLTGRILSNFFPIFADTKEELSTGRIDFDLEKPAELINKAVENYSVDDDKRLMAKLNIVKDLSNVIEDHPNLEMLMIHSPYRSSIDDLVDDIKVSLDSEKVKQFVKRRNI